MPCRCLERNGVRYDESVGWTDRLAYRACIAGPFRPYASSAAVAHLLK